MIPAGVPLFGRLDLGRLDLGRVVLLAAAYVVAAKASFALAFVHTSIAPVWLPSGIAVVAVVLFGYRVAPGVLLGAFVFNASTPVPLWVSGVIALGNTMEAVGAAWLLHRVRFRPAVERVRDVVALATLGAAAATTISASVGVAALLAGGVVEPGAAAASWLLWWSGDAVGVLSLAPVLLAWWSRRGRLRLGRDGVVQAGLLAVALPLVVVVSLTAGPIHPFLVIPILGWAAIRFRWVGASLAGLFSSAAVVYATAHGRGPFVTSALLDSLLITQSFVAVAMVTGPLFAALTLERERATEGLRRATAELAQRNRQLERERVQLDEAQRIAELGSWEWDLAADVVHGSDQMFRMCGLWPQSVPLDYRTGLNHVHPADRGRVDAAIRAARTDGVGFSIEHRIVDATGQVRVMQAGGVAERDPTGEVVRILGTEQDITERKRSEQALAAARDEALQASRLKSQFLATMSHEIRTPLNAILGLAGLILAGPLGIRQRRNAEHIRSAGTDLLTIIDNILDFSKIEAGRLDLDNVDFNLDEVIADVVALFAEPAAAKGLAIVAARQPDLSPDLHGDPTRLRQVLLNLVSNAVKFTEHGGATVSAHPGDPAGDPAGDLAGAAGTYVLEVTDTGIGIPADGQADLFEPFVQADASTTRVYGGTGLGLTISRRLVHAMGGRIELSSRPGHGTTLRCTLPLAPAVAGASAVDADRVDAGHAGGGAPTRDSRILLVEDNKLNRLVAEEILTRLGYDVDVAINGRQAIAMAEKGRYQAILMDCQMPTMDGYTATAVLRRMEHGARRTPIIAMTASVYAADRKRCLAAGMDDFIAKPFDPDELAATVARCIDRRRAHG